MPEKRDAFAVDIYFREAWADFVACFGARTTEILSSLGLLTFKPDAIVGRRMRQTIDYLAEQGFEIVGVRDVEFSRLASRELWRYNWNFATLDRIHLSTRMYGATNTLLLIVRDLRCTGHVPGAVRLSALKGSAAAEKRAPHHLRTRLRSPHRLINFVHVADEPADIVRELAILLDTDGRHALLELLAAPADCTADALDAIDRLERGYPEHDLDFDASLARRTTACALRPEQVRALQDAANRGRKLRWDKLSAVLPPTAEPIGLWDFICIGCWTLADEREGHPDLLPSVSPEDWAGAEVELTASAASA
jgi:hypothetical protein